MSGTGGRCSRGESFAVVPSQGKCKSLRNVRSKLAMFKENRKLAALVVGYTFVALAVYFPLETYVTWSIAGVRGFAYSGYVANILGMTLMLLGGIATKGAKPFGPALLAAGWSWTAATFWRATSDRFWATSLGMPLYAGRIELWLAPIITALAVTGSVASLVLVFRSQRSA